MWRHMLFLYTALAFQGKLIIVNPKMTEVDVDAQFKQWRSKAPDCHMICLNVGQSQPHCTIIVDGSRKTWHGEDAVACVDCFINLMAAQI